VCEYIYIHIYYIYWDWGFLLKFKFVIVLRVFGEKKRLRRGKGRKVREMKRALWYFFLSGTKPIMRAPLL
jgi:hypothetical protein